jgi:MscS family membrane protein
LQVERATFVGLLGRLFKILVGLVLIVALLTRAGVNVSALIAGLGIGGIALALAAQKTLADLFGGLSIIMRGAVRVGGFCQIDGITGTVEDIGISALSLRTLDRSIVSIPNSKVAEVGLQNFQLRDQFWLRQIFTLQFDTPHDVVKIVLDKIDEILREHPDIDKRSARARLINLPPLRPTDRGLCLLPQARRRLGRLSSPAGRFGAQDDGRNRSSGSQSRFSARRTPSGNINSPNSPSISR